MMIAARWCLLGSVVVATAGGLVAMRSLRSPQRAAPEPMIELGRCPDSAVPAVARVNRTFDYCVARYLHEVAGVRERDGQPAILVPYDTWFHVCAGGSFCSKRSSPDARVDAWRSWDTRNMFVPGAMACIGTFDGAARLALGDDGWPARIDTEAGTEVDRCVGWDARGPVVAGDTDN